MERLYCVVLGSSTSMCEKEQIHGASKIRGECHLSSRRDLIADMRGVTGWKIDANGRVAIDYEPEETSSNVIEEALAGIGYRIEHAAATIGAMMPGRFFLGLGTGENLNEHIYGDKWPPVSIRQEMLEEAVDVIRLLWSGGLHSHFGTYYVVENARIYTLPNPLPAIFIAAAGPGSAEMAGRIGDGLISTAPRKEIVQTFDGQGKMGRPHIGQITVCWGKSEPEARKTAYEWWRTAALQGQVAQELSIPMQFEQACATVREEDVAKEVVCGPDPRRHIQEIQKYLDAGYEQVYVHQVGPDQEGFIQFYQKEILPKFH